MRMRLARENRAEYRSFFGGSIQSVAPKMGCVRKALTERVKRDEVRAGTTACEHARAKALEREVTALRRATDLP